MEKEIKTTIGQEKPFFRSKKVLSYVFTMLFYYALTYGSLDWMIVTVKSCFVILMYLFYVFAKTLKDVAYIIKAVDVLLEKGTAKTNVSSLEEDIALSSEKSEGSEC